MSIVGKNTCIKGGLKSLIQIQKITFTFNAFKLIKSIFDEVLELFTGFISTFIDFWTTVENLLLDGALSFVFYLAMKQVQNIVL